jgi:methionyl aminopeptidase
MIQLKNKSEILKIKESGHILSETLSELGKIIEPGMKTEELDKYAYDYIIKKGCKPAFLGYLDFPASVCISINNEIIHGIPGKRKIQDGDIVSLDLGVDYKGYFSDSAYTFCIGEVTEERKKLVRVTEECLNLAVEQIKTGKRILDISRAVYNHAKKHGFGVVKEYCGHGVGFSQHEEPQIPNYVFSGHNPRLRPGMVIAIEPMINIGTWKTRVLDDNWTVVTADGKDSAHFEYTIAITEEKTEILTPFLYKNT